MTWTPENNTTPTGLLTPDQLAALKERGPWVHFTGHDWFTVVGVPFWHTSLVYRRKPTPAATPEAPALTEARVREIFAEMMAARELAPAAEPFKIEVGKFYRTRDGHRVGPITTVDDCEGVRFYVEGVGLYFADGTFGYGDKCRCESYDAIAEWVDEAPPPEPTPATTKPSVDWSQIAEPFDWIARDQDGRTFAIDKEPAADGANWLAKDARCRRIDGLIPSYRPGTCDWRDSLICRPGKEGGA